jgi:purine-binding chemotaxis protein CheW
LTELKAKIEETEDAQHGRYLVFMIGNVNFGIEIRTISEIIGMQPITRLPEVPKSVKGIINLRGKIIPVIDMQLKFNIEPQEYGDRTCIIVIELKELSAGLIVDRMKEVLSIQDEEVSPPPGKKTGAQNRFISGIGKSDKKVILLLDCEKLFLEEEIQNIKSSIDKEEK